VNSGFTGDVYPINPQAEEIMNLKSFNSILDVPNEVDLAVIAIPASLVLAVAEECGKKGVKALIVISAGFKEIGPEGAEREEKLSKIGEKYDMMIQGPNCLGLIDTYKPINLTFAQGMPKKGRIGFISQSGALGTAVLDWALKNEIGFHSFISLGNKVDLDEIDFIEALGENKDVGVILLYIESIKDGRKFIEVTRGVIKKKPIVVLKGGTSKAGAMAAGSHTGALVGKFLAYQKAFDKVGIIQSKGIKELFNYGLTFTQLPIPKNEGVAIVTNAGGPGILATDLIEKFDIKMADLTKKVQNRLREGLPPASAIGNPIDVLGDASADRYKFAMEETLKDENVYSLIVLLTPQAMTQVEETAKKIIKLKKDFPDKPIISIFMGGEMVSKARELLQLNEIPSFDFPEDGIQTLSALYRYSEDISEPYHPPKTFKDVNKENVSNVFENVKEEGRVVLLGTETTEVVNAYGIPTPEMKLVSSEEEAVKYAQKIGFPVVLKIVSPDILHKTDVGGVVLDINSEGQVRSEYNKIMNNVNKFMPDARINGILVYKMAPEGKEIIIGMSRDIQFGPLIMFGLGGIYTNFLEDVTFRLTPLSEEEAQKMMEETKAFDLLKGIRGEPPSDIDCVRETLLRFTQLVSDFPEIAEMDINPILVYEKGEGCIALDVKITLTGGGK
jgi:acetyltransferase